MSTIVKAVGSILGIGPGSPKVDTSGANAEVKDASSQASNARAALFATAGGAAGSDLSPGQVSSSRATLFGN